MRQFNEKAFIRREDSMSLHSNTHSSTNRFLLSFDASLLLEEGENSCVVSLFSMPLDSMTNYTAEVPFSFAPHHW